MKNILSVILCIILCIGCFAPTAFAQEEQNSDDLSVQSTAVDMNLTAEMYKYGMIKLEWDSYDGARNFAVYRSENSESGYDILANVNSTSYIDYTVEYGKTYYYKIVPLAVDGSDMGVESQSAACEHVVGSFSNLSANIDDFDNVVLEWDTNGYVEYCKIMRKEGNDSEDYSEIAVTYDIGRFEDDSEKTSTQYLYKVVPIITSEGGNIEGEATLTVDVFAGTGKVQNFTDDSPYKGCENDYKIVSVWSFEEGEDSEVKKVDVPKPTVGKMTSFKASGASYNSIKLEWETSGLVDGYIIHRSETEVGGYSVLTTITKGDINSFTDKNVETGKTYYYKIRPYAVIDGATKKGTITSAVSGKATLGGVTTVTAQDSGKLSANVNWDKVDGASGYIVYRSAAEVGGYSQIANVKTNSYTDINVTKGTYYYKIKPYRTVNGKQVTGKIGGPTNVYVDTPYVGKVNGVTAQRASYNSIDLAWEKADNADGYIIYRSETEVGGYIRHVTLKNGDATSVTIKKGIETGKTYYFKIRPYVVTGSGKTINGKVTNPVSAKLTLGDVTTVTAQDSGKLSVNVNWNKVDGASGYRIYRSATETGGYSQIASVSGSVTSYSDIKVSQNSTYYYKVKPYINVNGKKVTGGIGGPTNVYVDAPFVDDISGLTAKKATYNSVKLFWNKSSNADGYIVYRSENETSGFVRHVTLKGNGNTSVVIKKGLVADKTYYFKVVPYITVNGQTVRGAYSETVSARTYLDSPAPVTAEAGYSQITVSWEDIPEAEGYYIYRTDYKNGIAGERKIIAQTGAFGSTTYIDHSVSPGNLEYEYSIVAYTEDESVVSEAAKSNKVQLNEVGTVQNIAADVGITTAALTWDDVENADGYNIYYKDIESGEIYFSGDVQTPNITNAGLAPDTEYTYYIQAYVTENDSNICGEMSAPCVFRTEKIGTTVLAANSNSYNTIDLSWEKVEGVSGYVIYRSESLDGEYIYHTSRKASQTNVTLKAGIKTGTTYYIKIVPYVTVNGERIEGEASNIAVATPSLKPVTLEAVSETYDTVALSWNKVDGAEGYLLYRSTSENEGFTRLKTIKNADQTSIVNTVGVNTGTTYYYIVRPYITVDGVRVLAEDSNTASATPVLDVPTLTAVGIEYDQIELTWNQIDGANGYRVYRSDSPEGDFEYLTKITSGNTLSVVNKKDVLLGKTYYYKVRAFRTIDEKTVYGDCSSAAVGEAQLAAPTVDAVSLNCNQINISWNEVRGATGYVVYRSLAEETGYKRLTTIKNGSTTSVINKATTGSGKVEVGETYYYKVRAMREEEAQNAVYYSDYSNSDMAKAAPTQPKLEVRQDGSYPTISWNKIEGADGYILYRSVGTPDNFVIHTRIKDPDKTSVDNKSNVEVGQTYYYKVAAYVDLEDGSRIVGEPSEVKDIKVGNNLYIEKLCEAAEDLLGTPYVSGGKTESGVDCSGFVYLSFKNSGHEIPYLTSYEWARSGYKTVSNGSMDLSQLKRGDILCFSGHVGIYLGDGLMIDSGTSTGGVRYCENIQSSSYWVNHYICAKRVFE